MSSNNSSYSSNDEGSDEFYEESSEDERQLAEIDRNLFTAVTRNDAAGVQNALRNGANVNCVTNVFDETPLLEACRKGYDHIVRILLDAGANARWRNDEDCWSVIGKACVNGQLSIVEMLLNHDNELLEIADKFGWTPLLIAIQFKKFEIVHFLLDRGANAFATNIDGVTTLMYACQAGAGLEIVRRLLAAGVDVDAREKYQFYALHRAAALGSFEVLRELTVEHNANMLVVDKNGNTPLDMATHSDAADRKHALLIECYGEKLTQEHDRLALHAVLGAAECSFAEARGFHLPQNPIRIHLPLGKLTLQHFDMLLHSLDPELIRNRDDSGKLPIHIACRDTAPAEILALIVEHDATTLYIADSTGALPLHDCCSGTVDDSSVRFLVEHGGVATLAARNHQGALPLHNLCGSTNPSLRTVQYMIQSFSGSVAAQTNAGQYPFMIAACESSTASLSVLYALVRTNPDLVTPPLNSCNYS